MTLLHGEIACQGSQADYGAVIGQRFIAKLLPAVRTTADIRNATPAYIDAVIRQVES